MKRLLMVVLVVMALAAPAAKLVCQVQGGRWTTYPMFVCRAQGG